MGNLKAFTEYAAQVTATRAMRRDPVAALKELEQDGQKDEARLQAAAMALADLAKHGITYEINTKARDYIQGYFRNATQEPDIYPLMQRTLTILLGEVETEPNIVSMIASTTPPMNVKPGQRIVVMNPLSVVASKMIGGVSAEVQEPKFIKAEIEVMIEQWGLLMAFNTDVLSDLQLPLIERYTQMGYDAIQRAFLQETLTAIDRSAYVMFDNGTPGGGTYLGAGTLPTSGQDAAGNPNGTLTYYDWMNMLSEQQVRGYESRVLIMNPLAASIFYGNPLFGSIGTANLHKWRAEDVPGYLAPWGLEAIVTTPRIATEQASFAIGGVTTNRRFTDIYLGDPNGIYAIPGEGPLVTTKDESDWTNTIYVRIAQSFGVHEVAQGAAYSVARNINITDRDQSAAVPNVIVHY